jgi:ParB family transcriptional regulator, chromosome partitioning protein
MARSDELLRTAGDSLRQSASVRPGPAGMASVAAATGLRRDPRRDGLTRSSTAFTVPLEKIERDPLQPREDFDPAQIERLAESLKRDGLLQPITVLWSEEAGRYRIVTGERRFKAAQLAGWEAIGCNVLEHPLAPDELLALQCVENLMREDLKPIEQARAFRTLLTVNGWSITRLAGNMGISQSAVSQSLRLLDLPATVQASVESGDLPAVSAYHVAKIEDPAIQAEVAERIVAEGLSRDQTVEVVRQAKARKPAEKGRGGAKAKPRKVTERVIRTEAGIRVTLESRKGLDGPAVLAALDEARAKVAAELAELGGDQVAA